MRGNWLFEQWKRNLAYCIWNNFNIIGKNFVSPNIENHNFNLILVYLVKSDCECAHCQMSFIIEITFSSDELFYLTQKLFYQKFHCHNFFDVKKGGNVTKFPDPVQSAADPGIEIRCRWARVLTQLCGTTHEEETRTAALDVHACTKSCYIMSLWVPAEPYWVRPRARLSKQHRAAHCAHTCYNFGTHAKASDVFLKLVQRKLIYIQWDENSRRVTYEINNKSQNIQWIKRNKYIRLMKQEKLVDMACIGIKRREWRIYTNEKIRFYDEEQKWKTSFASKITIMRRKNSRSVRLFISFSSWFLISQKISPRKTDVCKKTWIYSCRKGVCVFWVQNPFHHFLARASLPWSILIASEPLELSQLINAAERKDDGVDWETKCSKPLSFSSSVEAPTVGLSQNAIDFTNSSPRSHKTTRQLFSLLSEGAIILNITHICRWNAQIISIMSVTCHWLKTIIRKKLINVIISLTY